MTIKFTTANSKYSNKFQAAIKALDQNTVKLFDFDEPVLIEGGIYQGIWLECGPLEALVYGCIRPEVAVASHRIFFKHQRENGYLPLRVIADGISISQIQMVVPIAATALEVYKMVGDRSFLEEAYLACALWDDWLVQFRDTRGTGLCELFCEYDAGHDYSPRFNDGVPKKCRDNDARLCPEVDVLPYLAPDLSATVYGGRIALAEMAELLGKPEESQVWIDKAQTIQKAIMEHCFDAENLCFFDLDNHDQFVCVNGDVLTRVLGEHVVDQELFDKIFNKHIANPEAFWTPYPLPSIAANDPVFDRNIPVPAWGGTSQALTALRAPRWFEHYGKPAHLTHMMKQWVKAIVRSPGFQHQIDPWTGQFEFTDEYSPTMCVYIDFVSRLFGIRSNESTIEWNCRAPEDADSYTYSIKIPSGAASLQYNKGEALLMLHNRPLMEVSGTCRIVTDLSGNLLKVIGTELDAPAAATIIISGSDTVLNLAPSANEYIEVTN